MENPRIVELLKEKFHYTPKDYYEQSRKHLFYSHMQNYLSEHTFKYRNCNAVTSLLV